MASGSSSDDHLDGAMIALLPSAADAKRLAIKGGEAVDDLHLTLYFLGGDATVFDDAARQEITGALMMLSADVAPITANVFGISHWNAGGDSPSWVWSVGDDPASDGPCLDYLHDLASESVWMTEVGMLVPEQHKPWVAHVCAAYTDDLTLAKELEKRLGPITFDRLRVTFGGDATDLPLTGGGEETEGIASLIAAALLHRLPTQAEVNSRVDFAMIDKQWKSAVGSMMSDYVKIEADQRAELRQQITAAVDSDSPDLLADMQVDTEETSRLLFKHMQHLALLAGKEMQREAEHQGVTIPPWDLNSEDSLTASSAIDVLRSVSKVTARSMGLSMVKSAIGKATSFIGAHIPGREVADKVSGSLSELSTSGPRESIGAAMSAAQNAGRMAVLAVAPTGSYFASEALDKNTCKPCVAIDGTEFGSLREARDAYPSGGYAGCQGGSRCRGTMISVWDGAETASASVQEEGMTTVTEHLGGDPNPGTKKDKRLKPNQAEATTEDLKADVDAAAATLEETTETLAKDCPPGMELDPATGECAAPKGSGMSGATAPWTGPLLPEGTPTGDGREFAAGALTWPDDPEPGEMILRWNKEDSHGGEPRTLAVAVGRIDKVWRENGLIMGSGVFDLGQPDGVEAHRRVGAGFLRGISIDADDITNADIEFVFPSGANGSQEDDPFALLFEQPEKVVYHGGRIRAATLCDIPAFVEAYIALTDSEDAVVAAGQPHPELVPVPQAPQKRPVDALLAHSGPGWKPPAEWFENPQLSMPVGIQVTDDGRIYGHAAQWGSCHIGQTGTCVQPPREDGHPYFMTGELSADTGKAIAVGQITVGTGHAPLNMAAQPAAEHYDHTGHAVADVCVGNDSHGIWVAGAIRPGADPLLVHELRASGQVSGDWRRIGGQLRMVGLLAVNVPGFPVPKMKARVASGEPQALVAAGRPTVAHGLSEEDARANAYKLVMQDLYSKMIEGK